MRILVVNYEYPPLGGGGAIAARDIAEVLAKRHEVHILTSGFRGLPRKENVNGVTVHRVTVWGRHELSTATLLSLLTFFPASFFRGLALISSIRPDIIHGHFAVPSGLPAALLAKIFRLPFVLTLIGADIFDPSRGISPHRHALLRAVVRWVVARANHVTAISNDTKERAIRYHGVKPDITVIPLGLVPPQLSFLPPRESTRTQLRKELHWDERRIHFVTVGRLVSRKGYDDLLEGCARMKEKDRVMLHIIGDGPLNDELRVRASHADIQGHVIFHGRVTEEEKYRVLVASDVYISTSHHEGFGICFLEAMYAGLPIIATNVGGQNDFLVPEKHAMFIRIASPKEVAEAMDRFIRDSALRQKLAEENLGEVQRYLIDRTADHYERVLLHVLQESPYGKNRH